MDAVETEANTPLTPQSTISENPNLNIDSSTKPTSGENILAVSNEKSVKRRSIKRSRKSTISPATIKRQKKKNKLDEEYIPSSFKRGKKKKMRKTKKYSESADTKEK